jgi:hypothetical protein
MYAECRYAECHYAECRGAFPLLRCLSLHILYSDLIDTLKQQLNRNSLGQDKFCKTFLALIYKFVSWHLVDCSDTFR